MKIYLTDDHDNGPWVETYEVVNGYHIELIDMVPRLGLSKIRASRLVAAALIRDAGGDWAQLETEAPKLATLQQYRAQEITAEAYLRSREGLAMDLTNETVARIEEAMTPKIKVSKGEAKPSGAQS